EYKRELANLFGWFADTQSDLGQLDSAIATRQSQISFVERLIAAGKSDATLQARLMPAHEGLGILLSSRGSREEGIAQYRLAVAQGKSLLAIDPSNNEWRDVTTNAQLELAKGLLALGRTAEANEELSAACAVADSLRAHDPKVFRWQLLETNCLSMSAQLALASGADSDALRFAQRAVAAARSERSGDPISDSYTIAAAYRLLGDTYERNGDAERAAGAWAAGLAQLPNKVTERPWETNEHAALLRRSGKTNEAAPLSRRLDAMGYHSLI
ncbi:MAG TPA: hypothetical protein VE820_11260, partial [Sphingomicrobium sp.]|nr:hypothetical protein [Sphingomicrobium sp.]